MSIGEAWRSRESKYHSNIAAFQSMTTIETTTEAAQMDASYRRKATVIFGMDLHTWEQLMLYSLGFAALAAFAVVAATTAVVQLQRDALRDGNERIAQLFAAAEASRSRIAQLSAEAEAAKSETAKAQAETARINLEIAKLKKPRFLDGNEYDVLIGEAKRFPGTVFFFSVQPDAEATLLMVQIGGALQAAGWRWTDCPVGGLVTQYPAHPASCHTVTFGMEVSAVGPLIAARDALVAVFSSANIEVRPMAFPHFSEAVHILIGTKPIN
jgi:hypothetical protein